MGKDDLTSDLILASTSLYRRRQLERLGLVFLVDDPGVDESGIIGGDAEESVLFRGCAKARAVFERNRGSVVIGSDQGLIFDGCLLGKGGNFEGARRQLRMLSGNVAILCTSLCVIDESGEYVHVDRQELQFRALSESRIRDYLVLDEPFDCAGSFRIESAGALLFSKISGDDPTAIEGLPLMALVDILEKINVL